jgi:hypothetical protein
MGTSARKNESTGDVQPSSKLAGCRAWPRFVHAARTRERASAREARVSLSPATKALGERHDRC